MVFRATLSTTCSHHLLSHPQSSSRTTRTAHSSVGSAQSRLPGPSTYRPQPVRQINIKGPTYIPRNHHASAYITHQIFNVQVSCYWDFLPRSHVINQFHCLAPGIITAGYLQEFRYYRPCVYRQSSFPCITHQLSGTRPHRDVPEYAALCFSEQLCRWIFGLVSAPSADSIHLHQGPSDGALLLPQLPPAYSLSAWDLFLTTCNICCNVLVLRLSLEQALSAPYIL